MACFVRLLGAPSVRTDDGRYEPAPSRGSALAYHVAYRGGWVDRGELCALLWPESDESRARASLRQVLHNLRAEPWTVGLEIERGRLRWPVDTDVSGDGATLRIEAASGSLTLLDGFRLPDAPGFEAWLDLERAAVVERWCAATQDAAREAIETGRPDDAIRALAPGLRHDPLDEQLVRLFLRACRDAGRGQEAWTRYQAFTRRLEAELGLEPAPDTFELVADLADLADTAAVPDRGAPAAPPMSRRAPARRPFVGRDGELERLSGWLREEPGVSVVVGPGGIGKTRLALETAARVRAAFEADPVTVSLEEAETTGPAVAAIAGVLGLSDLADVDPRTRVIEALRGRRALLVLDNVEQIDGVDALLAELSEACGTVAWLVTSRRRLEVPGARTLALGGLPSEPVDPDDATSSPAGELFAARVRQAGGELDPVGDGPAVEAICRAAGGMPLALELAAGWARVLSVAGVAERWAGDPGLEAAPGDDRDERHRTVRRVFDASWRLLGAAEREAALRLTAFHGGCSVTAAEEVAGVGLARVAALRDASMVEVASDGRIRMHALIDRWLRERARDHDAALRPVRDRHARYYLRFLREQEDRGQHGEAREAVEALQRERANLEAAWGWALAHGPWEPLAAGGAFMAFAYVLAGRTSEWTRQLDDALRVLPRDHLSWAVLEAHAGSVDAFVERFDRAYERCRAAAEVARRHDDPWAVGWAVYHHALTACEAGHAEEGRAAALEAAKLWTAAGERELASMAYQALHTRSIELDERERWYREGQALRAGLPKPVAAAEADLPRGIDLGESYGRYGEALALLDGTIATQRELAWNVIDLAQALTAAARIRILVGDLDGAASDADEAVELAGWLGQKHYFDLRDAVARSAEARRMAGDLDGARARLDARLPGVTTAHAEMHVARGRIALAAGDVAAADRAVHAARGHLAQLASTRWSLAQEMETRLLEVEVERAAGREADARRAAALLLSRAARLRFLPATLHGLALASGWLSDAVAERTSALVASHPATPYAARRTSGASPWRGAPVDGDGAASAGMEAVRTLALEAAGQLDPT
jgi:predicted ATPase/DNA-binding SARP family transcriptional activator